DKADVYFGASTGPTHIAGALGKRIVAIYPNKKTQSITRWGVFGNSNVEYIVPDENNPNEDYKNPYFDNFTEEMENKAVKYILEGLK
ncbi:MAG: lipopolysaccharide heptosyltransferase family protein, partial [Fusobacterium periodonticum]|nr:lipopolysaccharide heptosyltransferase family protein [Fusobacterium periodonticum]